LTINGPLLVYAGFTGMMNSYFLPAAWKRHRFSLLDSHHPQLALLKIATSSALPIIFFYFSKNYVKSQSSKNRIKKYCR